MQNHNAQALLNGDFAELPTAQINNTLVRRDNNSTAKTIAGGPSTNLPTHTVEYSKSAMEAGDTADLDVSDDEVRHLAKLSSEYYQSVARVGEQVADALAYAHDQGTLHRDIKPGNLLLDSSGTTWVADFGLAKLAEQDNVSRTGDIVGTLSYIPPESFSGPSDTRGDLYSLGLSLFELLTLRPAFFGKDRGRLVHDITEGRLPRLKKLNPNVPRDLETIVLKAVAHRPEDRYGTAADMASDLNCFLNDLPIKARRMSVPEQLSRWYRKNKLVAALSAAVLSLLVVLTVVFGVTGYRADLARAAEENLRKAAEAAADTAERERQIAQTERGKAEDAAEIAKAERQKARELAHDAIQALKSGFAGYELIRLPVSADSTLSETNTLVSAAFPTTTENGVVAAIENEDSASLVAPAADQSGIRRSTRSLASFFGVSGRESRKLRRFCFHFCRSYAPCGHAA